MIPVLEVGGTHVSAALVDPEGWYVQSSARLGLDAQASAADLVESFLQAAASLGIGTGRTWGVAMPDPFDYERGIGQFQGVGKFAALRGVDLGAALRDGVRGGVEFVNDADAFTLGEWAAGAAQGVRRCVGLTLGTGVGSGWLVDGHVVDPVLPPGGRLHRLDIAGVPLEDVVSRRAIRRAFADAGGDRDLDVQDIAAQARVGPGAARRVLEDAMLALGQVVGGCVRGFRADVLVVGGSMSASWDLLAPAFRSGARGDALPPIRICADSAHSPLIGAAVHALRR